MVISFFLYWYSFRVDKFVLGSWLVHFLLYMAPFMVSGKFVGRSPYDCHS
jgi:hypothetical protein